MARTRTGSVEQHGNHWDARIRHNGKNGPRICLDPGLTREEAKREAAELQRVHDEDHAAAARPARRPGPAEVTLDAWSGVEDGKGGWFGDRAQRGLSSVKADRPRWRTWISPVLGSKPIATITREDIEAWVLSIDDDVREGELSWKTAINAWILLRRAFKDASAGKVPALRVRKDNPTDGVTGPDRGAQRAKTFLYPVEVQRLLACEDVSISFRIAAALALYTGLRVAEVRGLECPDVNLEQGTIHVHRTKTRDGVIKSTKTKVARLVPIEPALLPLLRALHDRAGGRGPVITYYLDHNLSSSLREALRRAGVLRPELHVDCQDRTRVAIRWHDLRGTFCTWCAARGEDVLRVMARAGHEDIKTTQGYVQLGGLLATSIGEVFPPLALAALGLPEAPLASPPTTLNKAARTRAPGDRPKPSRRTSQSGLSQRNHCAKRGT